MMSFTAALYAAHREIHLEVGYTSVSFATRISQAIAVNQQIPAPTLHFKEGDEVSIIVHNHLDEGTAIHWHGLLVPWQMDGVAGIGQEAIPPGGSYRYQFKLEQSGTYWYHAHAKLQEQQGVYGAFIVDPKKPSRARVTKDYVVVLSDWVNEDPMQVLAYLKKDGDYYAPRFPLQSSLSQFIDDYQHAPKEARKKVWDDYIAMQQMRMNIYDFNDIAYDAFLLNGHTTNNPWTAFVRVGDVVRLRFIGAAANTLFRVKIPNTIMQMVHVQGNDVRPYPVDDFIIAPGETYDVLVKINKNKPYIIYAQSRDTRGAAVGVLTTYAQQEVHYQHVPPFPKPLPVTREMMDFMMAGMIEGASSKKKNNNAMHSMSHHSMAMNHASMHSMPNMEKPHSKPMSMDMSMKPAHESTPMAAPDATYRTSVGMKYQAMHAAVKTNDPNKPIAEVISMTLNGYMGRFIWFINGVSEDKAHPISLKPGKRYRLVMNNASMMYHPMHIHGHWFILRQGMGAYDPLVHTVSIPPGATVTVDLDTDASGQWLFHCHLLNHMMTGMARTFQYTTLIDVVDKKQKPQNIVKKTAYLNRPIVRVDEAKPINPSLVANPMAHPMGLWYATRLDIGADPLNNTQRLNLKGLYGFDYDKLELLTKDAELYQKRLENADLDIFYWHLISQFWAVKAGVNYMNQPTNTPYWQPGLGIEGLMPWFIDTDVRTYYYHSSIKLDVELSRDTQITNNFFIRAGVRSILATHSVFDAEIGTGLNQMRYLLRPYYRLMPGLNVFVEYENEHDYGAFKTMQQINGDLTYQNTLTLGLSALF